MTQLEYSRTDATPALSRSDVAAAQRRYDDGVSGFYVATFATGIVVAGPFKTMATAEYQAALREPPSMCVGEIDDAVTES